MPNGGVNYNRVHTPTVPPDQVFPAEQSARLRVASDEFTVEGSTTSATPFPILSEVLPANARMPVINVTGAGSIASTVGELWTVDKENNQLTLIGSYTPIGTLGDRFSYFGELPEGERRLAFFLNASETDGNGPVKISIWYAHD